MKTIGLPASMMSNKPCRPYTEYNLFFQLEREYILQIELGFKPDYEPSEIFDPSDSSHYQGPPLPSRYSDLILLQDWHLPGKERRRKRRHRKTHGMIGFQELSLKIADGWKNIDAETRKFCADLCDVGLTQYKVIMLAHRGHRDDAESVTAKTLTDNQPQPSMLEITPTDAKFVPTDRCSMAEVDAAFENDLALSMENLHESMSDITASDASLRSSLGSLTGSMVDIEDDEIIDMWKSAPINTDEEEDVGSRTIVSNHSSSQNVCHVINEVSQEENTAPIAFDPYGKNSYIDATMNDLKNIRKAILNQQIQMQSTIIQARRITKGMQNKNQGMYGFAARSA
jgi:hypothetical protein